MKPTVSHHLGRLFRPLPVTSHYVVRANDDFAGGLAVMRKMVIEWIDNAELHTRYRIAGHRLPLPALFIRESLQVIFQECDGQHRRGFSQAIACIARTSHMLFDLANQISR